MRDARYVARMLSFSVFPVLAACLLACKSAEAPAPGHQRIEAGPIRFDVPASWIPQALDSDKRRAMFSARLRSPPGEPDIQVLLQRPMPLPDRIADGRPPEALVAMMARALGPNARVVEGTLSGSPAAVVAIDNPALPLRSRTWLAVIDRHLVSFACSGLRDGAAVAEGVCDGLVETLRVADLPAPPPLAQEPLVTQQVGGLALPVPSSWVPLGSDWLGAEQVGGLRAPNPPSGIWESHMVLVGLFPGVTDLSALTEGLDASLEGFATHTGREPVVSGIGHGLQSTFTDGATATWALHAGVGTTGVEILCQGPERSRDQVAVLCAQVFDGVRPAVAR
jgi:hypothetical protein